MPNYVLPNIPGTVANWPLQGSLLDVSGNHFDLEVNTHGGHGPEQYGALGAPGLQGYDLIGGGVGNNCIWTNNTYAPLRLTGEFTIQWSSKLDVSNNFAYMMSSRGGGGQLLWLEWDIIGNRGVRYGDDNPTSTPRTPFGTTPPGAVDDGSLRQWGLRRTDVGAGVLRVELFRDGVQLPGFVNTSVRNSNGLERIMFGNDDFGQTAIGKMAGIRVLPWSRSAEDIMMDFGGGTRNYGGFGAEGAGG